MPPHTNVDHHLMEMPQLDLDWYEPAFEFNEMFFPKYESWEVPSSQEAPHMEKSHVV